MTPTPIVAVQVKKFKKGRFKSEKLVFLESIVYKKEYNNKSFIKTSKDYPKNNDDSTKTLTKPVTGAAFSKASARERSPTEQ